MPTNTASKYNVDVEFDLTSSRVLLAIVVAVMTMALISLWVLQLNVVLRLILAVGVLISGFIVCKDIMLVSGSAIVKIRSIVTEQTWLLTTRAGYRYKAMQTDARVFRHLVMFTVEEVNRKRSKTILVCSDAVTDEKHRQLRSLVLSIQASGDH